MENSWEFPCAKGLRGSSTMATRAASLLFTHFFFFSHIQGSGGMLFCRQPDTRAIPRGHTRGPRNFSGEAGGDLWEAPRCHSTPPLSRISTHI